MNKNNNLILGITGASGAPAAKLLIEKSPWPVELIASRWGREVCNRENNDFEALKKIAAVVHDNLNLGASVASGSLPTAGMVILPCSVNTLGKIAAGLADNLITRAAHCHLKEKRPLVLCLRETPLSLINLENAARLTAAGAIVMPLSPPFYMFGDSDPRKISLYNLMEAFVDRVLEILGHSANRNWGDLA